ncbi:signal recognition particle 9 kDa protein, putative [Eimeria necatrix]|uniref:Signal recognition particle 9 kDa protein, putative n=1 Tax=Eimeria necatrix TaxID=51315 RepID=U6N6K1_9EIME|nr:signal recognition particle 9 kDa protein, putative [Eimeria necatrix]CDJ70325.1 signal recognition particle 9 kDa protein, putative [Eimeria necatrix]
MSSAEEWDSFARATRNIFLDSPTKTRFCMKYRRSDCLLKAKVTNDVSPSIAFSRLGVSVFAVADHVTLAASTAFAASASAASAAAQCVKYRARSVSEVTQLERLAAAFMFWASHPKHQLGDADLSLEGITRGKKAAA